MTKETNWVLDQAHSEIGFKVRHLMITHVKGLFKIFDASIKTTDKNFSTAEIDLWIDASSINTGNSERDEHLKSADFFDVANHKQITFTAGAIGKADAKGYHELWGNLTMKGISKKIKLHAQLGGMVKDQQGNEKAGFKVAGKIKRSDWDLKWNATIESGGLVVNDDVVISCEVELLNTDQKMMTIKSGTLADNVKVL